MACISRFYELYTKHRLSLTPSSYVHLEPMVRCGPFVIVSLILGFFLSSFVATSRPQNLGNGSNIKRVAASTTLEISDQASSTDLISRSENDHEEPNLISQVGNFVISSRDIDTKIAVGPAAYKWMTYQISEYLKDLGLTAEPFPRSLIKKVMDHAVGLIVTSKNEEPVGIVNLAVWTRKLKNTYCEKLRDQFEAAREPFLRSPQKDGSYERYSIGIARAADLFRSFNTDEDHLFEKMSKTAQCEGIKHKLVQNTGSSKPITYVISYLSTKTSAASSTVASSTTTAAQPFSTTIDLDSPLHFPDPEPIVEMGLFIQLREDIDLIFDRYDLRQGTYWLALEFAHYFLDLRHKVWVSRRTFKDRKINEKPFLRVESHNRKDVQIINFVVFSPTIAQTFCSTLQDEFTVTQAPVRPEIVEQGPWQRYSMAVARAKDLGD